MTAVAEPDLDLVLMELLATPEGRADPYPRYATIRSTAPLFISGMGALVLTRYADCQQVLRSPAFGKAAAEDELRQARRDRFERFGMDQEEIRQVMDFFAHRQSILTMNPPDHTRLRNLVSRAFTPNTVEGLRDRVREICTELLLDLAEKASGGQPVDIMTELAFPLPVSVIGELLGVPRADRMQFQDLVRATTALLEPTAQRIHFERAVEARLEMESYFESLIADRRREPRSDLLSELIAARDGSDQLSEEEMISTAILLFSAGFETTTNLIGNGLLTLLRHPDEMGRLRRTLDDPAGLARSVEELLRYDSPVQLDGRIAIRPTEVAGHPVERGDWVMTLIGAANRDPERFEDPDRFDITRDQGPPMSFGSGIHYCLGAALARSEGQVVFAEMLRRFTSIDLATEEVHYRDTITLRGLVELPVTLS